MTSAPAISATLAASRATALPRNGLAWREEVLELANLFAGADADQHVTRLDQLVRRRRRVERPVALPDRDDHRARLVAHVQFADRLPGTLARFVHLDFLEHEVVAFRRRHDVEKSGYLRLEHEVRHHAPRGRVGSDDAVRARELQLLLGILVACARDDRELGPLRAGGERDVEVVGVGVGRGNEAARAFKPGFRQVLVLGAVALDEEVTRLGRRGKRVVTEVEHDVGDAGGAKLLPDPPPHAAVAADDEVVTQPFDRLPPPALSDRSREDPAGDRLDDGSADVRKDSHAAQHDRDGPEPAACALRRRVESVQRCGDDRTVERVEPALAEDELETERSDRELSSRSRENPPDPAQGEAPLHACIVGAWTRNPRSGSLTSTSTPTAWAGSTRTSRTSPSRSTSSRSRSRASTTRSRRATFRASSSRA